jgi:amino acid adenylation domain-containing protein
VNLISYLDLSAESDPSQVAVVGPAGNSLTYGELAELSDALRDRLIQMGVQPGDRVAFCLRKSIESIVSIFGIMKAGAAYVPLDPAAPARRNAYIANNCDVSVLVSEKEVGSELIDELDNEYESVPAIMVREGEATTGLSYLLGGSPETTTHYSAPDDLAYILYTSGSTGKPKGVMITHRNATAFVDWCSEAFAPESSDRFSSHAPLHFDLSIHDVHVCIKHGATLILISEDLGKNPMKLSSFIAERGISIWYSTPSILGLLAEFGNLDQYDFSSIRIVLFAGEVFPVKHLRAIKKSWPKPRFFNLYGPTETNVCTYFEVPGRVPEDRVDPYPIGKACSHYDAMVVDADNKSVRPGEEGELFMRGRGVTPGYWQLPDRTAAGYYTDSAGDQWYRTGDIVTEDADGNYIYVGRRDRMIKKRGYRVELGEIETCLYRHPDIEEAGVVAVTDNGGVTRVRAFFKTHENEELSLIALKQFCGEHMPAYMIPDDFIRMRALPRTSTDKVDYQGLIGHVS